MASFKVSEFTGVSTTTDDSLLMLSFTEDSGASYETRKIRIEDLFSNIAQDSDLSALVTLTGVAAGSVNLGSFTGSTISDNLTIKQALQQVESALEGKQTALTAGDGIAIDAGSISVALAEGAGSGNLTVAGYSGPQSFVNGEYTIYSGFSGTVSGAAGSGSLTFAEDSGYNIYSSNLDAKLLAYNTTESSWMVVYSPSGFGTPSNGSTFTVSTQGYDLVAASSVTIGGKNSPDASAWPEGTYAAGGGEESFLEFSSGKLKAKVLDEDNFASNSDTHLATQQSIKAYVDSANSAQDTSIDATYVRQDGTTAFTGDQSMGGFKLTNLGAPAVGSDAVTKEYVDSATSGQGAFWTTVRVGVDTNVSLNGLQTLDGITLLAGERVLLTGQTNSVENGIYLADPGAWPRATDANEASEFIVNKTVFISEGTDHAGNVYAYGGPENPVLGTSDLLFLLKQESAGIQDGSITTVKLADGAVTDAKVSDVAATKLTGQLNNSTVAEGNVTQHQAALSLDASQTVSGTFDDARIAQSNVTQHQAALSITESQISDLQAYALQSDLDSTNLDVAALTTLSGVAARATSLGTFTGSTIQTNNTIKGALQDLESAIEGITVDDLGDGSDVIKAGDNLNRLVGSTGADGEPAAYLFVVVDVDDGSIKVIDKTFIEIE